MMIFLVRKTRWTPWQSFGTHCSAERSNTPAFWPGEGKIMRRCVFESILAALKGQEGLLPSTAWSGAMRSTVDKAVNSFSSGSEILFSERLRGWSSGGIGEGLGVGGEVSLGAGPAAGEPGPSCWPIASSDILIFDSSTFSISSSSFENASSSSTFPQTPPRSPTHPALPFGKSTKGVAKLDC